MTGPPAWDVALFLGSSLEPGVRRDAEDELLAGCAAALGCEPGAMRLDYARALLVVFAGLVGWLAAPDREGASARELEVRRAALGDGRMVAAVLDHGGGVVRPDA